jgi:hypothetical protein
MPKTKTRKRRSTKSSVHSSQPATNGTVSASASVSSSPAASTNRRVQALSDTRGLQGLFMSALVAIGCWGFAYYTFLFDRDANSYLFAGMAALLALVWSISFFVRLRKWRRRR